MKKLFLTVIELSIVLTLAFACKKENKIIEYKVTSIERPGTFACRYTLASPGRTPLIVNDECGKYIFGQTVLKVVE